MNRSETLKDRAKKAGFPFRSSIEELEMWFVSYVAVIPYHDYVIVARQHPESDTGCTSAVYRFDSSDHTIEGPCTLVYLNYYGFNDMGDAAKDGFGFADEHRTRKGC